MLAMIEDKQTKIVLVLKKGFQYDNITMKFANNTEYTIGPTAAIMDIDRLHLLTCSYFKSSVVDCITLGYQQQCNSEERQHLNMFSV